MAKNSLPTPAGGSPTAVQMAQALADVDDLNDWDVSEVRGGANNARFFTDDGQYEYEITVMRTRATLS